MNYWTKELEQEEFIQNFKLPLTFLLKRQRSPTIILNSSPMSFPTLSSRSVGKLACAVANAQVDLNPHQVDAALFAFQAPLSEGALLADEVRLGKTIEAGLGPAGRIDAVFYDSMDIGNYII